MHFPVLISIGAFTIRAHVIFEVLGYLVTLALLVRARRRRGDLVPVEARWTVSAAALIGGVIGSRLLYLLRVPAYFFDHWTAPAAWPVGKTIVGGLIGGLIAVEWAKRRVGVRTSTGDLLAVPLAIGIAVGRVGCFLNGLDDDTFGNPTALWTGVDFGDGIRRHPTQLYEIVFLAALAAALTRVRPRLKHSGDEFRLFMVAYLSFRLAIDAIKPDPAVALGLSAIQWACVATLVYYALGATLRFTRGQPAAAAR